MRNFKYLTIMEITINDKAVELPEGSTLQQALELQGISSTGIATAVNNNVVARDNRSTFVLSQGDKILIIKAFYGG